MTNKYMLNVAEGLRFLEDHNLTVDDLTLQEKYLLRHGATESLRNLVTKRLGEEVTLEVDIEPGQFLSGVNTVYEVTEILSDQVIRDAIMHVDSTVDELLALRSKLVALL